MDKKTREWYENPEELAGAIAFLLKYGSCFDWHVYASDKTPCCDYCEIDASVPDGLREAIRSYIRELGKTERQELRDEMCGLLGERFYVKDATVVKILSRMLSDGDIRYDGKAIEMMGLSLVYKIKMSRDLLTELVEDVKEFKKEKSLMTSSNN